MTLQIADTHKTGVLTVRQINELGGTGAVYLADDEQRELLEALARIHGFTLVDREERKSLLALTEEIDEDPNDYPSEDSGWAAWQDRAEALASAVNQLFDTRQEV